MAEIKLHINEEANEAIAILPGEWVSYFAVDLPDFSHNKLEKIIPNILSDQLAGDIDNIHYSIVEKKEDGKSIVAVCDKNYLDKARELASKDGLILKGIWPDYELLSVPETGVSLYADDQEDRVLGKRVNGTGFAVHQNMVEHVVRGFVVSEGKIGEVPVKPGLAKGDYSPRPPLNNYVKFLSRAIALLLIIFVLWSVQAWVQISNNEEERLQYSDASLAFFRNTHPDVKRIVNVEAQMRALMGESNASDYGGFLASSDKIFNVIKNTLGIKLESISYDINNDLETINITISSVNFSQASAFESGMKTVGFKVIQGDSSQNRDIIFSRYSLQGGTP